MAGGAAAGESCAGRGTCEAGGGVAGKTCVEGSASEERGGTSEDAGGARLAIWLVSDEGLSKDERTHLI